MAMQPVQLNAFGSQNLPGHLGIVVDEAGPFLHAGSIVTLADTCAGYGCVTNLPAGATGFTTIELKSNFLGTARDGTLDCAATPVHMGKTTQVWDAVVTSRETGKTLALFRCTQMILYPKGA